MTTALPYTLSFEWDEKKARANLRKHGVSFAAATRVFLDPFRLEGFDDRFDYEEEREIAIGEVEGHLVTVVHTERQGRIRIISARYATRDEEKSYYGIRPRPG